MNKYDKGTQALLDDLALAPQSFARDEILRRARRFKYHDYKADSATPQLLLIKHLTDAGLKDLAKNVVDGKYDQGKDAADEWANSAEGRELFAEFGGEEAAMKIADAQLGPALRGPVAQAYFKTVEDAAKEYIDGAPVVRPSKDES